MKSHIARHRNPLSEKERNNKTSENSKATKKRSDKGLPKKAVATILSGYPATSDENKEIMRRLDWKFEKIEEKNEIIKILNPYKICNHAYKRWNQKS